MKTDKVKVVQSVAIVILAGLLLVSIFQIRELNERIDEIYSKISNIEINTRNQIDSIYSNVDERLKEEASLFSFFTYENGKFDSTNNTAELKITLIPKELFDDMEIFTVVDGKKVAFERDGNTFVGTLTLNAFRYYEEHPVVNVKTAQGTKTELLEIYMENLYVNYLSRIESHSSTISNFSIKDAPSNHKELTLSGSVYAGISSNADKIANEDFKSLYLVTTVNGEEVDRYDASAKLKSDDYDIWIDYSKTLTVKNGDEVEIFVEGEDIYGYIHKSIAESFVVTDDGSEGGFSSEEMIFDKQGKLLTEY